MPQKNNKGRGKPTHNILANQLLQATTIRPKDSDPRIQTLRHLSPLWHKMLMKKLEKSRSPGANISSSYSSTGHNIHSPAKSTRSRCSCLHHPNTHGTCTKRKDSVHWKQKQREGRNDLLTRQ